MVASIRLGLVTIGQAPRDDLTEDLEALLPGVTFVQAGALDGLGREEAEATCPPQGDDDVLVTRLRTGDPVTVGEVALLPRVEEAIRRVEADGVAATLMACSGEFPRLAHAGPLFFPDRIAAGVVEALGDGRGWGVVCPDQRQAETIRSKYGSRGSAPRVVAASPYARDDAALRRAGRELADGGATFILCDCIGYSLEMAAFVRHAAGVPVLTVRGLAARIVGEWLGSA